MSQSPYIKPFPCSKEEDPQAWLDHYKKEMPPLYQGLFKKDKEAALQLLNVQQQPNLKDKNDE